MKKLIALLLFCICLISSAIGESIATQTDLDDADWGQIDIEFPRQVFLDIDKRPQFIGDTVSLVAILRKPIRLLFIGNIQPIYQQIGIIFKMNTNKLILLY